MALSEYSAMWLFAMFDLPVDTKQARRQYSQFRRLLLEEGFSMLQFSVYARYFPTEEASQTVRKYIHRRLPTSGQIRLLSVTDRQFGKMEVFLGKKRTTAEATPSQRLLF